MLNYHDILLPPNQNAFLRELNRFSEFRKMTPGMRSEIISRAGNDGLKGVLNALDTIFDLGGSDKAIRRCSELSVITGLSEVCMTKSELV